MPKVLVVEDERDTRVLLETYLETAGYAVGTAANGREGLQAARTAPPCLILLDLMMPVMDGEQFRAAQQGDPMLKNIPVIVLSARHDAEQSARRMAAAGFVAKPLDLDRLLGMVAAHCAS